MGIIEWAIESSKWNRSETHLNCPLNRKTHEKLLKKKKETKRVEERREKENDNRLFNELAILRFVITLKLNTHRLIQSIGDNQKAYNTQTTYNQPKNFLFTCHYTPVYIIIPLYVGLKKLNHKRNHWKGKNNVLSHNFLFFFIRNRHFSWFNARKSFWINKQCAKISVYSHH